MTTQADLQRRNERLQLLLKVTNKITSNLDLREVIRSVTGSLLEFTKGDLVSLSLRDAPSGKLRIYALDYPQGKGIVKEGLLITPAGPAKRALDDLNPVVISTADPSQFPPEMYRELALVEGTKGVCLIPLVNHGRALGVMGIGRTTEIPFTEDEIEFLTQVAGPIAIAIENALAYEELSELRDKLAQEKLYLQEQIRSEMGFEQIIGSSATLKQVLRLVDTVAPSDSTVLLLGETGTGKELIARAVHDHSRRSQRIFVKLNCAAIPTGLLESEFIRARERSIYRGHHPKGRPPGAS